MTSESTESKEMRHPICRTVILVILLNLLAIGGRAQLSAEDTGVLVALPGIESVFSGSWSGFPYSIPIINYIPREAPPIPPGLYDVVSVAMVDGPGDSSRPIRCEALLAGGTVVEWTTEQDARPVLQNCRWLRSFDGLLAAILDDGSLIVGTNISSGFTVFSKASIIDAAISSPDQSEPSRSVWAVTSDGRVLATQIFATRPTSPAPLPVPPITNAVSVIYGAATFGLLLNDGRVVFQQNSSLNQRSNLVGVIKVWGGPRRAYLLHADGAVDSIATGFAGQESFPIDAGYRQIYESRSTIVGVYEADYCLGVLSNGTVFTRNIAGGDKPLGLGSLSNVAAIASLRGATLAVIQRPKSSPKLSYPTIRRAIEGYPMQLEVSVEGVSPFSYRWLSNGVPLVGATNSTLSVPQFRKEFAGDYILEVCNAFGCSTTQVIHVEALQPSAPRIWSVTSTASSGPGTLRELIQDANACGGGTVLMEGLSGDLKLDRPLPPIHCDIDIRGPGTNSLRLTGYDLVNALTVGSGGVCRISSLQFSDFATTSNRTARIENQGVLELSGCLLTRNTAPTFGGVIHSEGSLRLRNTVISSNTLTVASVNSVGAGVAILRGEFEARDCIFTGNRVTGTPAIGAAIYLGNGQSSLKSCVFSNNQAQASLRSSDSLQYIIDASGPAIYFKDGHLELLDCLISDNRTVAPDGYGSLVNSQNASGGSAFGGAVHLAGGHASIVGCTVARNVASAGEGVGTPSRGGSAYGGGLLFSNAVVFLTNCTVSANQAISGSGNSLVNTAFTCILRAGSPAFGGGIGVAGSEVYLVNCTLAGNVAAGGNGGPACPAGSVTYDGLSGGGAIGKVDSFSYNPARESHVYLINSIAAGNSGIGDIYGAIVSGGSNLVGSTNGSWGLVANDLWGIEAGLEPLSATTSGMLVHRLKSTSIAIDRGQLLGAPVQDQLGIPRPFGFGTDIGAVEFAGPITTRPPVILKSPSNQTSLVGQPIVFQTEASGTQPLLCQWEFGGTPIPGETNFFLRLASPTRYQDGSYRIRVSNAAGSATSPAFRLSLQDPTQAEAAESIRKLGIQYFTGFVAGDGVLVGAGSLENPSPLSGNPIPYLLLSTNGRDWSVTLPLGDYYPTKLLHSKGWFLIGLQSTRITSSQCACNRVAMSPNGKDWSIRELPYSKPWLLLASAPEGFIATAQGCCGTNDIIWISTNLNLEVKTLGPGPAVMHAAFENGIYLLQSDAGIFYRSTNRIDWSISTNSLFASHKPLDLTPWRNGFVRLDSDSSSVKGIFTSEDGLQWTLFAQATNTWVKLAASPSGLGVLAEASGNQSAYFSVGTDPIHWTDFRWDSSRAGAAPYRLYDLAYVNYRWVAGGELGSILISPNYEGGDISVHVTGPGSVETVPASAPVPYGQPITFSAIPAAWGRFVRWSDWVTNNPRVEVAGIVNDYTAVFEPTMPLETLSFGGVSREAPVGMPAILVDGRLESSKTITRFKEVEINFYSSLSNAPLAWSFDGSPPVHSPSRERLPKKLDRSVTIRVAVFPEGAAPIEAAPLTITIVPGYRLQVVNPGGGDIRLIPSADAYAPGTEVRVEASAWDGWQFMSWGDETLPATQQFVLKMDHDYELKSVFGTPFTSSSSMSISPAVSLYPYGAEVEITALPPPGSRHVLWFVDAFHLKPAILANPLSWTVTTPFKLLEPRFQSQEGFGSLVVRIEGSGRVSFDPNTNAFPIGSNVRLRAVPDPDQSFVKWSGDVVSESPEIVVLMNSIVNLQATFTRRAKLAVDWDPTLEGNLRFIVQSELGTRQILESRTDQTPWTTVKDFVNTLGEMRFRQPVSVEEGYRWYRLRTP